MAKRRNSTHNGPEGEEGPTAAQYVIDQLAAWDVDLVFGLAGDTIIPLLEALRRSGSVRYIGVRHEESAAFMASAYAKLTGRPGVCLAEAGPAAVHLLNGVYDAHLDRVPLVALTGESHRRHLGTRHWQTIDQHMLYEDATCFNHTLTVAEQLPEILYRALRAAVETPGAVRLGIPADLQAAPVMGPLRKRPNFINQAPLPDKSSLEKAITIIQRARQPLLFVGRGARHQRKAVETLAEKIQAPIVHTLPAMGIIPARHPRNLGVAGVFGTEAAAEALGMADAVIVIGSTWWQPEYVPEARYIQIDRDPRHLGLTFPADVGLAGDAGFVLSELIGKVSPSAGRDDWEEEIHRLKSRRHPEISTSREGDGPGDLPGPDSSGRPAGNDDGSPSRLAARGAGLDPRDVMTALTRHLNEDAVICLDVGENTYWVSSLFEGDRHELVVSGHWRSMGFGLPAAIAAALCRPRRQVAAVVGDGGFAMTMAEFTTAAAYDLPIVVVILNNQLLALEGRKQLEHGLEPFGITLHNPDFGRYAELCGGIGFRVQTEEELERALEGAVKSRKPAIIDVIALPVEPAFPRPRGAHPAAGQP